MPNRIKLKQSSVPGKVPTIGQLELGELAINTNDGKVYLKKNVSGAESIVDLSAAATADKLSTARTITIGSTGKSFDGSGNVSWTLAEIGAPAASSVINVNGNYLVQDTRSVDTPTNMGDRGVRYEFKLNTTDGLNDGGTYHSVMTIQNWADPSGGNTHQLGFGQNGNLWHRTATIGGTWGAWRQQLNSANFNNYAPTLTGTGASGTWGISITGNAANVTGTVAVANGGTGATDAATARTNLGAQATLVSGTNIKTINGQSLLGSGNIVIAGSGDVTGPASSVAGNLVTFNGTTGKVIQDSGRALPTGALVGTTDAQTLTNKTINLSSNTLTGTLAQFNAAISDADVPSTTGSGASGTWGISITGNAGTATKLQTARTISLTGGVSGSASFDGSGDVSITATVANNSHSHSNYANKIVNSDKITGRIDSGFYETDTASIADGWPQDTNSWYHLISSTHSNVNNYYAMQFAGNFYDSNQVYYRATNGSGTTAWNRLLHSGNYNDYAPTKTGGGASGTWGISITGNAATVTNGVYTTGDQTIAGNKTFTGKGTISKSTTVTVGTAGGSDQFEIANAGSGACVMTFHRWGAYAINMGLDTDNVFRLGGWSNGTNTFRFQSDTSGNFTAQGNVTAYSDVRLKTDLTQIADALSKVKQLTGYTYTRIDTGERQTGLIAQDVQKVLPEAVVEGEHLSLAYGNMVGLLVEAIKEQAGQIEALRDEVRALRARLEDDSR